MFAVDPKARLDEGGYMVPWDDMCGLQVKMEGAGAVLLRGVTRRWLVAGGAEGGGHGLGWKLSCGGAS